MREIVKRMILREFETAMNNPDNYDMENKIIHDYVAADVRIAMAEDNFENVEDMIVEILDNHGIVESRIKVKYMEAV